MKFAYVGLACLLSACAGTASGGLQEGRPGLPVAEAALAGAAPKIALNVANGVLQAHPRDVAALGVRGDAQTALGLQADAEATFLRALAIDPHATRAMMGLGRTRLTENPRAAEQLFLEVLQKQPRNAAAWNDIGIARDLQGRHAEAQVAYEQAAAISPGSAAQINLALSLALSGRAGEAVRILRPLAAASDSSERVRSDYAIAAALAEGSDETLRASDRMNSDRRAVGAPPPTR
jgi:Flp pilus assembly protein TadD